MKTVGYLIHDLKNLSPEEEAGWKFLASVKSFKSKKLNFPALRDEKSLRKFDLLWWHFESSVAIPDVALDPLVRLSLKHYVERGGSLLLSLLAAQYVADMNFDDSRPNLIEKGLWQQESWAKEYPDIRGFASFQGHPIFKGLSGGFYTWNPRVGTDYAAAVYNETTPKNGNVVAIERLYIKLNENWRIISEHSIKKGKVLSVGTFFFFREQQHRFRKHLEALTLNCLSYLTDRPKTQPAVSYWNFEPRTVSTFSHTSKPLAKSSRSWQTRPNGILVKREIKTGEQDQFFDVGGRRILMMGKERGGIAEVWCHPVRILKDIRIGFKIDKGETVWSSSLNPQVVLEPESLTRIYHVGESLIEEIVFSDIKKPAGGIHFRIDSKQPVEILVTAVIDLRMMWPLSDRATGSLRFAWDKNLRAAFVSNGTGDLVSVIGSSLEPTEQIVGAYDAIEEAFGRFAGKNTDAIQVAVGLRYSLSESQPHCTVAFSGTHSGEREAVEAYKGFLQDPVKVLKTHAEYFDQLLANSTRIISPDQEFNDGYRWAMAAADRFFVNTPGVGESLVAGYGLSSSGWDGGQKISGRPGYAWYFGRDSVWASFAMLGYGDFEKVRRVLEFLGRYQDLNGKILHELTTSGYAHYDAADSTPLYIILMGRYLRATSDTVFARKEFDRLRKAISFCFSTDTDGDHLIENTNVGHGWVEGGGLFPVHTEHYLASCWSAALREASYVADALKQKSLAQEWAKESKKVQETILDEFWNPETEFYNFAKRNDKTFSKEKTILPAVGMYLGIAERDKAEKCLAEYASANFSSDWGTRIIRKDNPMYNPQGYHYGSVWPLFTGWTSLAEFRWNRPVQGFIHAMNNLLVFEHFAGGYVEEVMQGEKFQPAGVCPHQAWSETMVLQPLLEGMLGLRMNSLRNELTLRPYFPCNWPSAEVRNIRVGRNRISMTMKREKNITAFRFRSLDSRQMKVTFQPWLPLGTAVNQIKVNNEVRAKDVSIEQFTDAPTIEFTLAKPVTVTYRHRGGLAVVPPVPHPVPHQESSGLRFIDEQLDGRNWIITVEGKEGLNYELGLMDFGGSIKSVQRAGISHREGSRVFLSFTISGATGIYQKHVIVCQT